jgi:hypothetical protein
MNLEKLEVDLRQLQERYLLWNAPIYQLKKETHSFIGINGYTEEDCQREIKAFYQQQLAEHNPRLAMRSLINKAISIYESVSPKEREAIRDIFGKFFHASGQLLGYIIECAECLEIPKDANIFRLGLIAASIENYAFDFRDTDMILAELAIAAAKANIDIEPHGTSIAKLCSDERGKGGGFMKRKLAQFHIYAPKAVRLVPYDWINGVELPE